MFCKQRRYRTYPCVTGREARCHHLSYVGDELGALISDVTMTIERKGAGTFVCVQDNTVTILQNQSH